MAGRGRPRKAQNPDTKCAKSPDTKCAKSPDIKCAKGKTRPEEMKQEEKQNGTTTPQKKTNPTEEKPSVQKTRKGQTVKHLKEEINKQQTSPADNAMAPEQGSKANAEKPRATKKGSLTTTKAKTETSAEQMTKTQPETPTLTKQASEPKVKREDQVDSILKATLEKLKIKRDDRSDASKVINSIVEIIIDHLKVKSQSFKDVQPRLPTGSYYENLKISNPDEFDVMIPIPVDRVKINPFGDDGAFYSVELKRGKNPLQVFETENGTLSASKMLKEFRDEVKKSVKQSQEWKVERKKKGCPAVTLITTVKSITISLDIVLSIMVKSSWPSITKDGIQIDGWLGTKIKQEYKRMPYYLVPKFEGSGAVEHDGVLAQDTWRISFSHVEKAILKNHGSEKTCCEKGGERCCRKDCLKLLKHLLRLLKEQDSSFDKFCSYHAKTTLLNACCSRTKDSCWRASSLSQCFQLLLHDFIGHLEKGELYNFFIPTQNLLSSTVQTKRKSLARRIREECDQGFPIFK